jgi:hypothetical protein
MLFRVSSLLILYTLIGGLLWIAVGCWLFCCSPLGGVLYSFILLLLLVIIVLLPHTNEDRRTAALLGEEDKISWCMECAPQAAAAACT